MEASPGTAVDPSVRKVKRNQRRNLLAQEVKAEPDDSYTLTPILLEFEFKLSMRVLISNCKQYTASRVPYLLLRTSQRTPCFANIADATSPTQTHLEKNSHGEHRSLARGTAGQGAGRAIFPPKAFITVRSALPLASFSRQCGRRKASRKSWVFSSPVVTSAVLSCNTDARWAQFKLSYNSLNSSMGGGSITMTGWNPVMVKAMPDPSQKPETVAGANTAKT